MGENEFTRITWKVRFVMTPLLRLDINFQRQCFIMNDKYGNVFDCKKFHE